jgi:hypothetical protein
MVNANDFTGRCDSEILNRAVAGRGPDGIVVIPPRTVDGTRDFWLLDEAVRLPENTTLILQNAHLKLSDRCRDNFFRSANCGLGIEDPARIRNIHIRGQGTCLLEGADHPRATGDSSKRLHAPCPHFAEDLCRLADWLPEERRTPDKIAFSDIHDHSYGTDAGVEGESQYGDWRGIGILLANVEDFSISGLRIKDPHGWAISLEACANGRVERIDFDAQMHKMIDGTYMNMENQDGIDLRNGCHHIIISDITGRTGDDVIALTAIANPQYKPGGSLCTTHVMHNDWTRRERGIHDIIIRNVIARSYLCCMVRLLPVQSQICNVVIDNVIGTATDPNTGGYTAILLGEGGYGEADKNDCMRNIAISNVICSSQLAVSVRMRLVDSVIGNVVNKNPNCPAIRVKYPELLENVATVNTVTANPLDAPCGE